MEPESVTAHRHARPKPAKKRAEEARKDAKVARDRQVADKPAKRPATPLARRSRIPVALAAAFALAVVITSFPFSTLLSQHRQLSAAAVQLHQIQSDNRLLSEQDQQLSSTAEIDRLAREDYQLVLPNQTLYDVLPPTGRSTTSPKGAPTSGDPGNQPLVEPSKAPDMSPDPGLPQTTPSSLSTATERSGNTGGGASSSADSSGNASSRSSFWSRVAGTLEFWK